MDLNISNLNLFLVFETNFFLENVVNDAANKNMHRVSKLLEFLNFPGNRSAR